MNAVDTLVNHVVHTQYDALPSSTVQAAKMFIYDSIGVGISGSHHPRMAQIAQAMGNLGSGAEVSVWGTGQRLPMPSAVLMNAYQVFNQEFDAVHDKAVVHAFACILPASLAYAERSGTVSGRDLIAAVTLGLDVAIYVALAQRAPMRFFRPAMCGCLGATAALSRLAGFDTDRTRNALGLAYSHLSGTMQAHIEGSPAVGLQVGLNARAAVTAFELASAGFPGPADFLEGPFGYFQLFDFGQARWDEVSANVGRIYQIERMSHKPYPTGRATHAGIDAARALRARGITPEQVKGIKVHASALIGRLVGRPSVAGMDFAYAKLCMGYVVATALRTGTVGIDDFKAQALADPVTLSLALAVQVVDDGNPDPNALGPQAVEVELANGESFRLEQPHFLGSPEWPLPVNEQDAKFKACCRSAIQPFSEERIARLADALRQLDGLADLSTIVALIRGESSH